MMVNPCCMSANHSYHSPSPPMNNYPNLPSFSNIWCEYGYTKLFIAWEREQQSQVNEALPYSKPNQETFYSIATKWIGVRRWL